MNVCIPFEDIKAVQKLNGSSTLFTESKSRLLCNGKNKLRVRKQAKRRRQNEREREREREMKLLARR